MTWIFILAVIMVKNSITTSVDRGYITESSTVQIGDSLAYITK